MASILARALGLACLGQNSLSRVILPRSLSAEFKKELADTVESEGGTAFIVGSNVGEVAAGEAAQFRTLEDGSGQIDVVLVASEGDADELKTNEGFRDLLASGLPGGLDGRPDGLVRASVLASHVARLSSATGDTDPELANALENIFSYLADAYEKIGNEEQNWLSAYWQHLEYTCDNLRRVGDIAERRAIPRRVCIAYASAGMPKPSEGSQYDPAHDATAFARRVKDGWSDPEAIERSVVSIDMIDGAGDGSHPMLAHDWDGYPASRANLGHPVLAMSFHGKTLDSWPDCWLSCSEKGFFTAPAEDLPAHELFVEDQAGQEGHLVDLGLQGVNYILPPASPGRVKDGRMLLATCRLRLNVQYGSRPTTRPIRIEPKPTSAAIVETTGWQVDGDWLEVHFQLSRKVGKKGKWREAPVTLAVEPTSVSAHSTFKSGFTLKVVVPHPRRATLLAAEHSSDGRKRGVSFPANTGFIVQDGYVEADNDAVNNAAPLKLRNAEQVTQLFVVGLKGKATWPSGHSPKELDSEYLPDYVRVFEVAGLPEDATLDLGNYSVEITVPEIEKGQVNPVFAALTNQPQVAPAAGMLEELRSDPRGPLEDWLSSQCIWGEISRDVRSTLGTCILSIPSQDNDAISWNDTVSAFSDIRSPVSFRYPDLPSLDVFWDAFEELELASLPGAARDPGWPSALDLRELDPVKLEAYLEAFAELVEAAGNAPADACVYYPFSALLFDVNQGSMEGVLMSPLHPLRLAWSWSVQTACVDIAESPVYSRVATSFLRFVDGESIPLMGPSLEAVEQSWFAVGLSTGPAELFSGWSFLADRSMISQLRGTSLSILGRHLPFGTPSGLDKGGVTVALKDYLRVYPSSPKLRIGLATPTRGERYPETDDAIIAASTSLLADDAKELPGGIRVLDSANREGNPPSAARVLDELATIDAGTARGARPSFEWTVEREGRHQGRVDVQFIENSIVKLNATAPAAGDTAGTTGPRLPVNRFRVWQRDEVDDKRSSICAGIQDAAYSGLPAFPRALSLFEARGPAGKAGRLVASLSLGHSLMSDRARWTVTGNRHLDPSVLSAQLRQSTTDIALWEWRPAFLKRRQGQSLGGTISSSHPYTVLAKPPKALVEGIKSVFLGCGIRTEEDGWNLISQLGMRGVGLSSLLTMGHSQSVGAVGFSVAFNALAGWENASPDDEVRCIVPMDAVYPLLDALAEGARDTDDQKRADLLLISVHGGEEGDASVVFHPVEVKMRTNHGTSFPEFGSSSLKEPLEQLASTNAVLTRAVENFTDGGSSLVLVNAALATLIEAGLAMRPVEARRDADKEAKLLTAVAEGRSTVSCHAGTLLWFQARGAARDRGKFKLLPGRSSKEANQVLVNPEIASKSDPSGTVQEAIRAMLAGDDLSEIYSGQGDEVDPSEGEGEGTQGTLSTDDRPSDGIEAHGLGERLAPDEESTDGQPGGTPSDQVGGGGHDDPAVSGSVPTETQELLARVEDAFEGFVGNERAVQTLKRDLMFAYLTPGTQESGGVSLAVSYLLTGPPSTGKTELSRRIAKALGLPFVSLDGKAVESRDSLFKFIRDKLEEHGSQVRELGIDAGRPVKEYPPFIVLIDEVHLVRKGVQEALLTLLEPKDRQVTLNDEVAKVPHATFLLATTRASEVDSAFKTRCTEIQLRPYTTDEVAEMLNRAASGRPQLAEANIPVSILRRLAGIARSVPRVALQLLDELEREIVVSRVANPSATMEDHVEAVRQSRGIDESGLGPEDLEVLELLQRQDRPLSESQLLGMLSSVDKERFVSEISPFLSKLGFLRQTGQGRVITDKGRAYLLERDLGST